ncbi:MAG: hypothetical protein GY854_08950 [Deltaproteobacteria bacterium]|nr:hypothetical protein [Deltaproteobacteria bacterium]
MTVKTKLPTAFLSISVCFIIWSCNSDDGESFARDVANASLETLSPTLESDEDQSSSNISNNTMADVFAFNTSLVPYVPSEVFIAAEDGIEKLSSIVQPGHERPLGFKRLEDLEEAKLGIPYEVMSIPTDALNSAVANHRPRVESLDSWMFPIIVQGKYTAMMRISFHQDRWQVVQLGKAGMAREAQRLERENDLIDPSIRRAWVASYQTTIDFLAYAESELPMERGQYFLNRGHTQFAAENNLNISAPTSLADTLPGLRRAALITAKAAPAARPEVK